MLQKYVHDLNHGRLVHSTEFINLFLNTFPEVSKDGKLREFCDSWLNSPGMSQDMESRLTWSFPMYDEVKGEIQKWVKVNQDHLKRKKKCLISAGKDVISEQLVLILEGILEQCSKVNKNTLEQLDQVYQFQSRNADVQHRFCELIVKASDTSRLTFVLDFLRKHQAMGIYLYGEMIMSKSKVIRKAVKTLFQDLKTDMDLDSVRNITSMLDSS